MSANAAVAATRRNHDRQSVGRARRRAVTGRLGFDDDVVARRDPGEQEAAVSSGRRGCNRGGVTRVSQRDRDACDAQVAALLGAIPIEIAEHDTDDGRAGFGEVVAGGLRAGRAA